MLLFRIPLSRFTFFALIILLRSGFLHAQSSADSQYIPSIIPPSPNAAALMKFTDVPVSTYTGTTDITVPIYTIKAKGITVPVNLSYHTGGIRLKEEASWVGLGWALNAGGMISRTVMGNDDFGTQGDTYFTNQFPQYSGDVSPTQPAQETIGPAIGPYVFGFFCNYQFNFTTGTQAFNAAFPGDDFYDMEPDIFSYNFPGHSGKFILTRLGQVVMQKQENIRIQFQGSGNQVTFSITDDQGNTFYFNALELVALSPKPAQISSWLLTKIVTQQQDSILFTYQNGGATTSVAPDFYQSYGRYCTVQQGLTTTARPGYAYYNQTLKSINFPNGHLQFVFDSTRNDLLGAYKLDSVLIYSKNASGTQTYLKQDNLYYSYFNPTFGASSGTPLEYYRLKLDSVKEKSGSAILPPYVFTYNDPDPGLGTQKHAYNVDHWGYYNGASNSVLIPSMQVIYQPPAWVFNPMEESEVVNYSGANRSPSLSYMETFSLQQMTYPTGGKTVLTYGANDYDYKNSLYPGIDSLRYVQLDTLSSNIAVTRHNITSGNIDFTNIYPVVQPNTTNTNVTVTVSFRYQSSNNTTYSGTHGMIYFSLGGTIWDIGAATCPPGSSACTISLSLGENPAAYSWSAEIDPSIDTTTTFSGIFVNIQYYETQQVYNLLQNNSLITPASGLRIQSITNYRDAGTIASEKVYTYDYLQDKLGTGTPQQYSFGRLMCLPSYARYQYLEGEGDLAGCTALFLSSSTITSTSSSIQGNIVGYDRVIETSVDPLTGQDLGKTVYTYFNSPDTMLNDYGYRLPGTLPMGNNLNGLLLSKTDYADNSGVYAKVAEMDNYYHTTNRVVYFSPKYQYVHQLGGGWSADCTPDTTVSHIVVGCFYPSFKSERVLLDSTMNISYQQGDTTQFVAGKTVNYYDNPAHYQVTRKQTVDSKGDTMIMRLRYPQDYIPSGNTVTGNAILDSLIGRNMLGEVIERQDSLYYPGSSAGYVTGAQVNLFQSYATQNNTIFPSQTYRLDIQSPISNYTPFSVTGNSTNMDSRNRQMISFDHYDISNNIQQYTPTDQNPVTIIWDYNHVYPIAQVKNAAIADVAATSFEADATGNWNFTGTPNGDASTITGNNCYNLGQTSGNISKSSLTSTTTYVLSYWIKSNSPLTIAGTISGYPIQGKTINGWTYFEHKITGVTGVNLSGTSYIDELRLYPANAQMTTYTYLPLVGTTTTCDVNNKVTYYIYDGFQRLLRVKDQDGNIVKTYQYHYTNQTN